MGQHSGQNPSLKLLILQKEWNSRVWRNGDDANDGIFQTAYLTVSILPFPSVWTTRKPFAPSGLLLFREQRVPARGRSSQSTDLSSIFHRLRIPRKEWQGFPLSISVALGHNDVDLESDASQMRTAAADGKDAVRHCSVTSVSGGRLRCRGNPQATISRTSLPDAFNALVQLYCLCLGAWKDYQRRS